MISTYHYIGVFTKYFLLYVTWKKKKKNYTQKMYCYQHLRFDPYYVHVV